ncbi:lysylphosphatidylglycerol synthase transmembrane domain-containing protein [Salinactinospora qingdaonensis]|uniref:Lysylphosphatidylglycerol synthase transmembrane domain-containing protein n=1 Tax=Salinactinospora qingdaonensis TaxID=702744 RepID=A0ABP7FU45_9ACTN
MRRRVWPWARTLAGVAILLALGWQMGTEAFVAGLGVLDVSAVLAALALGLWTTACNAGRWYLVARRLSLRLPPATALADYYRAMFLNVVLPAGVLGDAHRAVSHGRRSGDLGRGVRAVVLERVGGQLVLIVVGAAVLLARPSLALAMGREILPGATGAVVLLVSLAALVGLAAWLRFDAAASRWRAGTATAWADTRRGLLARETWPGMVVLSLAALAGNVALFVVAARAVGTTAPLSQLVPVLVLALLVMALPVNVGGWGPREAFLAFAFAAAGLGAEQGLTVAVACGVLTLVASVPGAAVLVLRRAVPARPTTASTGATSTGSEGETAQLGAHSPQTVPE